MKADEKISREEAHITWLALALAIAEIGQVDGYSWLSSRQGRKPGPGELDEVLGKSGYFGSTKLTKWPKEAIHESQEVRNAV